MTNLAKNVPFSVFVGKLLEESFPPGYFNTHKLKHVSKQQRTRLYGINNLLVRHNGYASQIILFIDADITSSFKSPSVTMSKKEFRFILKGQIKKIKRSSKRNTRNRRGANVRKIAILLFTSFHLSVCPY